jgi:hypothetical protein
MKKKILLWSVILILIGGVAAGVYWWPKPPQVVVLADGTKLTLLAVTYGKHHAFPHGKKPVPFNQRPPAFNTQNNALVVWLRQEHPADHWPNYQLFLYDKAGTACVGDSGRRNGYGGGSNEIVGVEFDAFPRRQGKLILQVQEYVQNEGQVLNEKHFLISNPARGVTAANWTAEPLPSTKSEDDLSVTLTKLDAGVDGNFNRDQSHPDDAINKGVEAVFQVKENGTNAANWLVTQIETTDATGNRQTAGCNSHWDGDDEVVDYQFGLWPDEPAWKLRVEFSQQSGFSGDELWTVKNIPLKPGNQQDFMDWNPNANRRIGAGFAETNLQDVHLKIYPARQFTNVPPNSQPAGGFYLEVKPPLPDGVQLAVVKVTDDQDNDLENWNYGTMGRPGSTEYHYGLRELDGVTNLNVTVAVHKNHFFEFTVKPQKQ